MGNRTFQILVTIAVGLLAPIGATGTAQATPADAPATRDRSGQPGVAAPLADSGPWHLVNRHSGRCLTIRNISTANNAEAVQWDCEYTAPFNEDWFLDDLSPADPYFHIVNSHSGKCLTIRNVSTANDAPAVQWDCDWGAPFNEEWYFEDLSSADPYYHIRNRHTDKCLTILNIGTANNTEAVQYDCDYGAPFNEEWQLVP